MNIPWRRPCVTQQVADGLSVTVSYHPETLEPCEFFLTERGKASAGEWPDALYKLGVEGSKLLQGK